MPRPVPADLDTLEALFVDAIQRIEPRHVRDPEQARWRHDPRRRQPGACARVFRLVWDADFETPEGVIFPMMVDTTVPLIVEADYGGVPDQVSTKVADSDSSQLRETLHALQHITPGLITVRKDDPPWEYGTENQGDQAQIRHRLLVRYWKQR